MIFLIAINKNNISEICTITNVNIYICFNVELNYFKEHHSTLLHSEINELITRSVR